MNSAENLRGEYHLLSGVVDQVGDDKWRGHEEERGPGGKCFTFKTLTNLDLDSTKSFVPLLKISVKSNFVELFHVTKLIINEC